MGEDVFVHAIRGAASRLRGRVSVDVGANHGFYTKMLAEAGCSSVLAFEPHPRNLAKLRHSTRDLPNVIVHDLALGDKTSETRLWVHPHNQGGHTISLRVAEGHYGHDVKTYIDVKIARLDDVVTGDIGLIKIDVEGAEELVLRGAQRTLTENDVILALEVHQTVDLAAVHSLVTRCGLVFDGGLTQLRHDSYVIARRG